MIIPIDEKLIKPVISGAGESKRRRMNYNFHASPDDPLQRMLQVLNPGTYIQPHRHKKPDKREAFILVAGRIAVLEFDDFGEIANCIVLDRERGTYGVEIPARTWHTLIALENNSVVYEVKDGPYAPLTDKNFAPWAPMEGLPTCESYLEKLLSDAGLA